MEFVRFGKFETETRLGRYFSGLGLSNESSKVSITTHSLKYTTDCNNRLKKVSTESCCVLNFIHWSR